MENVTLIGKITEFLRVDSGNGCGTGCGTGYGTGYGSGTGYGDGTGTGSGTGTGYGDGCGTGYGDGTGTGCGTGYGAGSGCGTGYGTGDGTGTGYGCGGADGYGSGLYSVNGYIIYDVDGMPTIFRHVHGNVAKGFILSSDLTMTPIYIVKGNDLFAHGKTLHEAMEALTAKMFEDMPEEERIAEFIKEHPNPDKAYPNQELFEWHNKLTGSCLAGREDFVKDRGLTLDGATTVKEFIKLTKNAYGGSVIKNLEAAYES